MHHLKKQRSGCGVNSKSHNKKRFSGISYEKALKLFKAGLFMEAESLLESHIKQYPKDDSALSLLGIIAYQYRQYDSAIRLIQTAIKINDREPAYHNNLGAVLKDNGDLKGALPYFQNALDLNPDYCDASYNLGSTYQALGELSQAIKWYDYTLVRNSVYHLAYNNKACTLKDQGRIQEAIEVFQEAKKRKMNNAVSDSNYLFCLNYLEEGDPESIFRYHLEWATLYAPDATSINSSYANDAVPYRRLRVGYVSADFRIHSVTFFMYQILINHNREQIEVYCYADVAKPDKMTNVLEINSDHWKSIYGMSDDQVFQCIQDDHIDILVDLSGHSGNNRMRLFSMKPAPIQVSYLGYPNTTGQTTMDYRITDAIADPPGMSDQFYTEKLIRLPEGFLCYNPLVEYPEIIDPPCLKNGFITFGSFNNRAKINSKVIELWSDLLLQVPASRLVLKSSLLSDTDTRQSLLSLFVQKGVSASRIEILPFLPFEEHLKQYQRVDVALDTFPYNGTTTTCDALWMGVPVITLAGNTHASRVGASILSHLGLNDWIISSIEDYVNASVKLATNIKNIKHLRHTLRQNFQKSSLMDGKGFVENLESAYRRMWIDRCTNLLNENNNRHDVLSIRIPGDVTICVPNDISGISPYILLEYQDWFEREIAFVRIILKSGMMGMDVGSGYGVYALTIAKSIGPDGKVWAFEPSRLNVSYLRRSSELNLLNNITVIENGISDSNRDAFQSVKNHFELELSYDFDASEIKDKITLLALDEWMQIQQIPIDFIRINVPSRTTDIIEGGRLFFKTFSPLVLYKIKSEDVCYKQAVHSFFDIGYESYRLIPGLGILAPVTTDKPLDCFQVNFFCCKKDRAVMLRQQQFLVNKEEIGTSIPDALPSLWIDYLHNFPYSLKLLRLWQAYCETHLNDSGWKKHQQALIAYAVSQLPGYRTADRYTALTMGYDLMKELLNSYPTVSRVMTSIRMANDLGHQQQAANMLNHIYDFFESNRKFTLDEPFLAVSERLSLIDPGDDIGHWLIYGVLETRELCQTFSSYISGKDSLPVLDLMRSSSFYGADMERRRQLIVERFGVKSENG